jgi:hypothetical protein
METTVCIRTFYTERVFCIKTYYYIETATYVRTSFKKRLSVCIRTF